MEDWEVGKQKNVKRQSPIVEHQELYSAFMEKNKKNIMFMCITESHCCAGELNATLKICHTSI